MRFSQYFGYYVKYYVAIFSSRMLKPYLYLKTIM